MTVVGKDCDVEAIETKMKTSQREIRKTKVTNKLKITPKRYSREGNAKRSR